MADKMTKKGENTQQAVPEAEVNQAINPLDEIIAMKAAADQRRQEIRKEIDSLTAELNEASQAQMNAKNSADFQTAYEKAHALNALIEKKKAEYESVKVDISKDSIFKAWDAYAEKYAEEIKVSLETYRQEKRKLYEMLIALAEKHNEFLKVRLFLGLELNCQDKPFSQYSFDVPIHLEKYDNSLARFFDNIIKKGDYTEVAINNITNDFYSDLDDPDNKTEHDQFQRCLRLFPFPLG